MVRDHLLASAAVVTLLAGTGQAQAQTPAEAGGASQTATIQEVVVTGTAIRGTPPVGSSIIGVTHEDIQKAAALNAVNLLQQTVPQVSTFNALPNAPNANGTKMGNVFAVPSLRPNLGTNATLLLVDGHRMVGSGFLEASVDPQNVPPDALDRVEVLADGASAVYGSDAVAGVINFVTRKNLDGLQTNLRYGFGDHYSTYDIGQTFGTSWKNGSFYVVGDLEGHSNLAAINRPYFSNVGTIAPGLSTSCPTASFGPSQPRCDLAPYADLQPRDAHGDVFANLRQTLSDNVEAWGQFIYSNDQRHQVIAQPALPPSTFAAGNPFNTTGSKQTVFYVPVTEYGAGQEGRTSIQVFEGLAGVDFKLPSDWRGSAFVNIGRSLNDNRAAATDNAAYQAAMASTNAATAFDPFGHRTSAAVLGQVADGVDHVYIENSLYEAEAKADGTLIALPTGDLKAAVGADFRRETEVGYRQVGDQNSIISPGVTGYLTQGLANAGRNISSVFGELSVPLIGSGSKIPFVKEATLSLAARYDNYSDVGGTTNPKVGLDWRPVDDVKLFANWSTAFEAPTLGDTAEGSVDHRIQVQFNGSPFQPAGLGLGAYTGQPGLVIAGGSQGLAPQRSQNYAFGGEVTPHFWAGFRASATYYHVDFKNFIGIPFGVFANSTLKQYGILAPMVNGSVVPFTTSSPEVTQFTSVLPVDGRVLPSSIYWIAIEQRVNLAEKIQSGIDFDVSQRLSLGDWGSVTGRWAGTYINSDTLQGAPGGPFSNVRPNDSAWQYRVSLDYRKGPLLVGIADNHLDGHYSPQVQTVYIKSFDVADAYAIYNFEQQGWFKGVQLSLNIDNMFDRPPPRELDAIGGTAPLNTLGRMVTIGIHKRW